MYKPHRILLVAQLYLKASKWLPRIVERTFEILHHTFEHKEQYYHILET